MIQFRKYDSYRDYINHQTSKLDEKLIKHRKKKKRFYRGGFYILFKHLFKTYKMEKDKFILCLGARLGEEVYVWRALGLRAIGIDLNPGPNNNKVIPGDFHDIPFRDSTFDYIFTNSLDHCLLPFKLSTEMKRVLKQSGMIFIELKPLPSECVLDDKKQNGKPWYESFYWESPKDLISLFFEDWPKMIWEPFEFSFYTNKKATIWPRPCLILEK